MAIDLERARAETPGFRERVHFNNAGASLMPSPVVDAVIDHLRVEARIGGYEARAAAEAEIERTYDAAAELIGAQRNEIALLENATRAWDAIFYGLPFSRGDRILTSVAEYSSNYIAYLHVAAKTGVEIVVIENDDHGQLDVGKLAHAIDERTKLISITHVPTSGGVEEAGSARTSEKLPPRRGQEVTTDLVDGSPRYPSQARIAARHRGRA